MCSGVCLELEAVTWGLDASVGRDFIYKRQAVAHPTLLEIAVPFNYEDRWVLHDIIKTGHRTTFSGIYTEQLERIRGIPRLKFSYKLVDSPSVFRVWPIKYKDFHLSPVYHSSASLRFLRQMFVVRMKRIWILYQI
jgi:hypothetical protein